MQQRSDTALLRIQPCIPGTQGQSIGLANRRHGNNCQADVQVGYHPPDDCELLRILLSEICSMSPHDLEQFHHYCRYAPHKCSDTPSTSTKAFCGDGYISFASGANTISTPRVAQNSMSCSIVRA